MRPCCIEVGKTYRFRGYGKRELKPRTVVRYDPNDRLPGGRVAAHTGITETGMQSDTTIYAGEYFASHVLEN